MARFYLFFLFLLFFLFSCSDKSTNLSREEKLCESYSIEHFNGKSIHLYADLLMDGTIGNMCSYLNNIYIVGDTGGQRAVFIHGKL